MWTLFSPKHRKPSPSKLSRRTRAPRLEPLETRLALATYNVISSADSGVNTLRWAIEQANASVGEFDLITTSIGGDNDKIFLHSALPPLTDRVRIEGLSTGNGQKLVINGAAVPTFANGLQIEANQCEVKDLVIENSPSIGIYIIGSGNIIYQNEIRFHSSAQSRLDPGTPGIAIGNWLGGASHNTVRNNLIHDNSFGMGIGYGASDNVIEDNVIEDNLFDGIFLFADGDGIQFAATSRNVMRGNVIKRNANGIVIAGGVDPPINNGVNLGATDNTVEGNTITANRENGVLIDGVKALRNIVRSNSINDNGTSLITGGHGVRISGGADGNIIGGDSQSYRNEIHGNHGDGVMVQELGYVFFEGYPDYQAKNNASLNNTIRANDIFNNTGLPIDLDHDGVTSNDVLDGDSGSNNLQNFPVINVAHSGANTYVSGSLNSLPGTWFKLDFYASSAGGQRYLGQLDLQTDPSGNLSFDGLLMSGGLSRATVAGETLFATATDPSGNTSEYCAPATVTDLIVAGTAADDTYVVQQKNAFFAEVFLNGASQGVSSHVFLTDAGGSDNYTVNFDGMRQNIVVTLNDTGATGTDTLTVNGTEANETLLKQVGFVQWKPTSFTDFQARVDFSGFELVTLNGAAGNDTIHDPGTHTTILGGDGDDTIMIDATFGNGVVADGGDGSDTYVVMFGNLAGPVTVADSGVIGSDSLTVQGTAGDDAITLTGNEVRRGTETVIIAAPVESLVVNGGDGSDTMSVVDFMAPISNLGLDGGGGTNTVSVEGSLPPGVEFEIVGATQTVAIEILRGDVNLASSGVIAVAVFTTASFDAALVDPASVVFAGAHAVHSALEDVDGDGDLDRVLHFRTQDTNLRALYEQLLADDLDGDGVLDSTHKELELSLTGQTVDEVFFEGFDELDLFLSGKSLRELLLDLAAAGRI